MYFRDRKRCLGCRKRYSRDRKSYLRGRKKCPSGRSCCIMDTYPAYSLSRQIGRIFDRCREIRKIGRPGTFHR